MKHFFKAAVAALSVLLVAGSGASAAEDEGYHLLPGDSLQISVWREEVLDREVVVLPDGHITFPLAGRTKVKGLTTTEVEEVLTKRLGEYLTEPVVTVSVEAARGYRVYLLGKVNTPGPYIMSGPTTVSQILSLAGGFDRFAELDDIKVLRGQGKDAKYFEFNYDNLVSGNDPAMATMLLEPGDVIIVP